MGLTVLPPDINRSQIRWSGRDKRIRVGLLSVKGLSAQTQKRIVAQRLLERFGSLRDALLRLRPDEAEARALIYHVCSVNKHAWPAG